MKISIPKDVWVTAGVIVAMFSMYAGLVWWPAHRQRNLYETRAGGAMTRLTGISASEAELARLTQDVADLQVLLDADEHVVPGSPQLSSLLRSLTESVQDQGVVDQELRAQDFQRFKDYSVVPATLEFVAGFGESVNVLKAIEQHRRLTAVHRTSIRQERGLRSGGGLSASVQLSAFYTDDQEARP